MIQRRLGLLDMGSCWNLFGFRSSGCGEKEKASFSNWGKHLPIKF